MAEKYAIYDTDNARNIDVKRIVELLRARGCNKVLFKKLAPNDNSKNQPYFGCHLTDLSFLPTGTITGSRTKSTKSTAKEGGPKFTAEFPFYWIDTAGNEYLAPNSKLIYYPQYPEVRFSGFLLGSSVDCRVWMDPERKGRAEGRILLLGVNQDKRKTFGFLAIPGSRISNEINDTKSFRLTNVFNEIQGAEEYAQISARDELLRQLKAISKKEWIDSKRLDKYGIEKPYCAPNGGGYTLEAELGVIPNGDASPDFLGWEVKQFAAKNFLKAFENSKALTLFTPEPTGGIYAQIGAAEFVKKYGVKSNSKTDRYDFTGRHFFNTRQSNTGLLLSLTGFDLTKKILSDAAGGIVLLDSNENVAAEWSYAKIIERWKIKHTQAVYVPSQKRNQAANIQYRYSHLIRLYYDTNINLLLNAVAISSVYYDPGVNVKNALLKSKVHARSQFRIRVKDLGHLYENRNDVDLTES